MNSSDRAALWDRLRAEGLAEGDVPPARESAVPWYVRAMIGIAGWIAACFLLVFVGVGFEFVFRTGPAAITVGLVLCGAAIALFWKFPAHDFVSQFALAASVAGQALVVAGLFMAFRHPGAGVFATIAVFEIALALIAPHSIHRTLSTFAASMLLLYALILAHLAFVFPALIAMAFVMLELDAGRSATPKIWQPISAGLALGLLLVVPASLAFGVLSDLVGSSAPPDTSAAWMASVLAAVVLVGTVAILLMRNNVLLGGRAGVTTLAACAAVALAAWQVPALIAALTVIIVAFASGRRALMGLGIVAMAANLAYYYYSLDATLFAKSMSMLAIGALLLAARFAAARWISAPSPETRHA